jgi:hypothetical protein
MTKVTRLTGTTDARSEALAWLATQLRWEDALDDLRRGDHADTARAA